MEDTSPKRSFTKAKKSSGSSASRSRANANERPARKKSVSAPGQRSGHSDERPMRKKSASTPERRGKYSDEKPVRRKSDSAPKQRSNYSDENPRRGGSPSTRPVRSKSASDRTYSNREERTESGTPGYKKHSFDDKLKKRREFSNEADGPKRTFRGKEGSERRKTSERGDRKRRDEKTVTKRKRRDVTAESAILTEIVERRKREGRQSPQKQKILSLEYEEQYGPIRLNKYIANSGICSRRDADMLITTGAIKVNGQVVTELGTKVMPTDEVRYEDRILQREKPVYVLLNKPKDYITTTYDERDRKDVMELIKGACKERVYPVGRLDKNTTGLLLFTNNGEMAKKLTHPKHRITKTYHVELNKSLSSSDFDTIITGFDLDDGFIKADDLAYVNDSKREVGITIHSGRNRIVRRIFEHLGYDILKLDRVVFAGLTKKNLPRGKWRFLTEAEVNILNML